MEPVSSTVVPEVSSVASISFDEALPITAWHDEIAATIAAHQVVVVAGETGSGKTTQLPKICLELGRTSIGHTQPRRIAARTVAERIAEELQVGIGQLVGYQVRFTRMASRQTRLKVMTDGVLLAEIAHDRDLRRYDTIIIDEAHERSLNIDFLLGYLKQLLVRRRDLKLVVTSATIDTARFAEHFAEPDGTPAPVIEVSGRTFPVEVRYRPLLDPEAGGETDQIAGITEAVKELSAVGGGDILVFLSGEREIRDTAEAINGMKLRGTEVLPLYARLSAAEQHKVFTPPSSAVKGTAGSTRRIVLATNVAETSLTVPGIRYVVDTGTARISRYSARTKVQRLPIEPISQASANQRSGRCGRVAPGVAIRLYDEEDFAARPEFTEPEILRTNLASVILQMTAAGLGDIAAFPFVEAPDGSQIADGLRLLEELGALAEGGSRSTVTLTEVGRRLAVLPVDPRMGRMLLAAEQQGCLREMLVIVSGLSIQDPRERPAEHREAADALHRRFWAPAAPPVPEPVDGRPSTGSGNARGSGNGPGDQGPDPDGSDFIALLRLWDHLKQSQRDLSGNAFRRMCRDEFLHFLRIREWQDLHSQLKQITRDLGLHRNENAAAPSAVHTAVLSGLLSHVGLADVREETPGKPGARRKGRAPAREYLGARGTRFAINPGSSVARSAPPLVMAAEIVETTRLWARTVAAIRAEQVEEVGRHLLKRQYSEPHWSARAGSVLAYEQVSLYGVPIIARRPVSYGRVAPAEAREIFLRSALVEGQWRTRHHFFRDNQALRAEAEALEERARRRDLVVDDDTIFAFYDARVPAGTTSVAHFDSWWKKARHETPDLLTMTLDDLTTGAADLLDTDAFPDTWTVPGSEGAEHELAVAYLFEPGTARDGVTVRVPVTVLNQLDGAPFSWQVPGLRAELATELVRSLPKATRRNFVPAPEFATRALAWLAQHPGAPTETLPAALGRALRALTGEVVAAEEWNPAAVPTHLRVRFVVLAEGRGAGEPGAGDPAAGVLGAGEDLEELKQTLARQVRQTLSSAASEHTRTGLTTWDLGALPEQVQLSRGGHAVVGYPALVDEGATVGVTVLDTPERQATSHAAGLRRLVLLGTPDPTKWVIAHLGNAEKLALGQSPYPGVPQLLADARLASVGSLVVAAGGTAVRDAAAFQTLCDTVRADNADRMREVVRLASTTLAGWRGVLADLPRVEAVSPPAAADLREQLANLVFPGFLAVTAYPHLVDLPRYLQAARIRIDTLLSTPARDATPLATISRCEDAYAELCGAVPPGPLPAHVEEVGWLLEELRVGLFAQPLRTKVPASEKRVMSAVRAARARL
ncbi:ATP-dependent helicase HrpA [Friedmanniella luteola]|uniref:ATP-dependent helicase HrpA n=1 Tax=Friedmanniella luteola TaxID=546871 RepID=A0A1H1REI0_9ACTN|nr:ATP-dependent RNA helicase HrpA [Friedmanniella luteola]SDS34108.1 ATP-dependent helicase HrpA [Friedmanniella luteola]